MASLHQLHHRVLVDALVMHLRLKTSSKTISHFQLIRTWKCPSQQRRGRKSSS